MAKIIDVKRDQAVEDGKGRNFKAAVITANRKGKTATIHVDEMLLELTDDPQGYIQREVDQYFDWSDGMAAKRKSKARV